MLQHRGIQNFEIFQKSIKNFADFYPRIKGASDIDFFYERKGNFLILEDKTYNSNETILLYYGEMKALISFWKLSEKIDAFIIAHNESGIEYKMIPFSDIDMNQMCKSAKGIWCMNLDVFNYPYMTKKEMIESIGLIVDKYEGKV